MPEKKPCWASTDPAYPDFPDPPHWTTKVWRCAKRKLQKKEKRNG